MKQQKWIIGLFVVPYYWAQVFGIQKGKIRLRKNQIFRHPYQKAALRLVIHLSL